VNKLRLPDRARGPIIHALVGEAKNEFLRLRIGPRLGNVDP
jgi:hypothetical protein